MKITRLVIGLFLLLTAAQVFADPVTLTFNELSSRPVNGVSISGVTFGYTIGGKASDQAIYNSSAAGSTNFIKAPALVGSTQGLLTLDFSGVTNQLSFAVALNSFNTLNPGFTVKLYDASLKLINTFNVQTLAVNNFTENIFSITGSAISRAEISFNTSVSAFALDNLTFNINVPEPASLLLLGSGLAGVAALLRRRKNSK